MDWGIKSPVSAFHYKALVDLSRIANHLGKKQDAAEFSKLAEETKTAFNTHFWNEKKGVYVDGTSPEDGRQSSHASAHANFFPLALGLVPQARVDRVADYLQARGMVCSVYGAQFLIEALASAGRGDAIRKLLTADGLRSWRNMTEKVGATMTLEAWDPTLKPNLDYNHALGSRTSQSHSPLPRRRRAFATGF